MKYLLVLLLWGYNAGAQTVGELRFDNMKTYVTGLATETVTFKSYAEQQAFYRNYGRFITGFDSSMLCKHIYVATYRDTVESSCRVRAHYMVDNIEIGLGCQPPAAGTHTADHDTKNMAEGISLVCVKCFHQTRQKILYKHK